MLHPQDPTVGAAPLPDALFKAKLRPSLIECTQKSELLGAGLQTVSDGKLLESGGSYYIDMQAGQQLAIKEGKTVEGRFPSEGQREHELFMVPKTSVGRPIAPGVPCHHQFICPRSSWAP